MFASTIYVVVQIHSLLFSLSPGCRHWIMDYLGKSTLRLLSLKRHSQRKSKNPFTAVPFFLFGVKEWAKRLKITVSASRTQLTKIWTNLCWRFFFSYLINAWFSHFSASHHESPSMSRSAQQFRIFLQKFIQEHLDMFVIFLSNAVMLCRLDWSALHCTLSIYNIWKNNTITVHWTHMTFGPGFHWTPWADESVRSFAPCGVCD